jgi:hypothetical protein
MAAPCIFSAMTTEVRYQKKNKNKKKQKSVNNNAIIKGLKGKLLFPLEIANFLFFVFMRIR